jgi:adenylate cyclase
MMKRILLLCLSLLPLFATAQQPVHNRIFISKDSLPNDFNEQWKFREGDDPAMALPAYDDAGWTDVKPALIHSKREPKHIANTFNSIAWFRMHFLADTSLVDMPLSLSVDHFGASEVYLDGKLVQKFGAIKGKDSSEYFNPQHIPFIVHIDTPGQHVIAVRYANYKALHNYKVYDNDKAGFTMRMGEANDVILWEQRSIMAMVFILTLLSGIFIALAILHFILYLYYRSSLSNLYFSLFCLGISFCFFLPYLKKANHDPSDMMRATFSVVFFLMLSCFALSGFINELFSRKKLRFYIIAALCAVAACTRFFDFGLSFLACIAIMTIVSAEAVVVIGKAIYKGVKGARIIGAGILLFAVLFLALVMAGIISGGSFDISDATTTGKIIELIFAIAILSIPISMSAYLAWSFASVNKNLQVQLSQVQLLSEKTLAQEQEKKQMLENRKEELEQEVALRTSEVIAQKEKIEKQHEELKAEKKKSDDLLLNILPEEVAEELKQKGFAEAKLYDNVSVVFTDFVDFTKRSEVLTPSELVAEINHCFKAFDNITMKYGLEKIKTIGDAYMAVAGLPMSDEHHAENAVRAALEIRDFMVERIAANPQSFTIRIGLHSGSVVAGIVGVKKFAYDIWGDTVNTAARMEQHGEAGKINISEATYHLTQGKFEFSHRGEIEAKNKGKMKMYFVEESVYEGVS